MYGLEWGLPAGSPIPLSGSDPSPVQSDDLSGQIIVTGGQVVDQSGYLVRSAHAAGRDLVNDGLVIFFRQTAVHVCIDHTAGNGIDLDMAWGPAPWPVLL